MMYLRVMHMPAAVDAGPNTPRTTNERERPTSSHHSLHQRAGRSEPNERGGGLGRYTQRGIAGESERERERARERACALDERRDDLLAVHAARRVGVDALEHHVDRVAVEPELERRAELREFDLGRATASGEHGGMRGMRGERRGMSGER